MRAEDNGQPASLSTALTMRVRLLDINDNEPSYINVKMPQVLHVVEENSHAYIGQTHTAFDADTYPNNLSCYFLYGMYFCIQCLADSLTSKVTVVVAMDELIL